MNHTRLCSNQVHWPQKHIPSEGIGQFFDFIVRLLWVADAL